MPELGQFLLYLGEDRLRVRPVKAHCSGSLGKPMGPGQGRQGPGDSVQYRLPLPDRLFGCLDPGPVVNNLFRGLKGYVSEHMRVSALHLFDHAVEGVAEASVPLLFQHVCHKDHQEDQVAHLVDHCVRVAVVD